MTKTLDRFVRSPDYVEPLPPATILVVDDPIVSGLVTRYLAHLGYVVLTATSGEEALEIVRRREPPVDLVLGSARLPDMDGAQLASWVLAECPGPQVLLMDGSLSDELERIPVRSSIVRVVRKPLDLDRLPELLRGMLDQYLTADEWELTLLAG